MKLFKAIALAVMVSLLPVSYLHAGVQQQIAEGITGAGNQVVKTVSETTNKVVKGVQTIISNLTSGKPAVLSGDTLRIATYNIAYGRGNDRGGLNELGGKPQNLLGVARIIKNQKFDIVGTTETACADLRGGLSNQPAVIANYSGLRNYVYGENHRFGLIVIGMGNAIFSKFPIVWSKNHALYRANPESEQRGCLEAMIDLGPARGKIRVFVTHLSLSPSESNQQLRQICKIINSRAEPCVMMGDLNSSPTSANIKLVLQSMTDVSEDSGGTYWPKSAQNNPSACEKIDYIFSRGKLSKKGASWVTGFKEGCSDHGCVAVSLQLTK
ncbi:MAG TPA: endonuclease/exonuclease/phosphatase family protein [Candidatus Rifleibacterium sp.]|nr:endonuclease/exonuclease/phosphatase family protein [Candidatus Rifleibacterium sp.]HPT44347.1 endonuclease/exonuclease/phosphatase family protein [Candidatus Rifleibacterium sp.]